jgi:hypothetical protein
MGSLQAIELTKTGQLLILSVPPVKADTKPAEIIV